MKKPVLAVIGSGWGGFILSQKVSMEQYHLKIISPIRTIQYTPLLASAACGLFNFRLAEEPVRRKQRTEVEYYKAIAHNIDFEKRIVRCKTAAEVDGEDPKDFEVEYDKLCIAPGCDIQDFGTPGAKEHALFLRTTNDSRLLQQRLLEMMDQASLPTLLSDPQRQRDILNIRIVGGGAIGIEAAAELVDLWNEDMRFLFPHLDGKLTITIHDVAPSILTTFDRSLAEYATESLTRGKQHIIQIKTSSHIEKVDAGAIYTKEDGRLPYGVLIWATGNKVNKLVDTISDRIQLPEKGLPRILTDKYLRVLRSDGSSMDGVYALGDAADIKGESLPTLAEVALQKGEYLTEVFNKHSSGDSVGPPPFEYKQRALLAYLGQQDGIIAGKEDWTGKAAWVAWRSGSLGWTRSWRRKLMISISWLFVWFGGRDIARY
ncbi:hypothetical protein J7T55_012936 [Diaporthe amygdali]|uniref:uncharacterized protein n=1 Tax=Phomopsis amygdali TaxID=1214568 RepID=UPI0022FE33B3|nr:uncharacterized protein J7T55_012936 [Diaporthe amygdali]KAJ0118682.1 hypothetical protein J7T55_012936 [Diaporthe amygdali]